MIDDGDVYVDAACLVVFVDGMVRALHRMSQICGFTCKLETKTRNGEIDENCTCVAVAKRNRKRCSGYGKRILLGGWNRKCQVKQLCG